MYGDYTVHVRTRPPHTMYGDYTVHVRTRPPHTILAAATYLQNVTFERMASGVIVSCEFAASDQDLLCRVTFSIGTEVTRTVTANVMGDSSPPVASVVVSDLPQEVLEYSVEAVNVSDGMAIEEFRITGMISLIPEGGDSGVYVCVVCVCVCVCVCVRVCVCVCVCECMHFAIMWWW